MTTNPMGHLLMVRLPESKFQPICCGQPTLLSGPVRYPTSDCATHTGQPVVSTDRWVRLYEWQCRVDPNHHDLWWVTTDEPAERPR